VHVSSPRPTTGPSLPPIRFGRFELDPVQPRLLHAGAPVAVGTRALQLLALLAQEPGRVMATDELVQRLWPRREVDDSSLRVQVAALRRVLTDPAGHDYISNVRGRGYCFLPAPEGSAGAERAWPGLAAASGLPLPPADLVGREDDLARLLALVPAQRLVTVAGEGGIGKTALAFSAARVLAARFAEGLRLVDLSSVQDPEVVPQALAAACGLHASGNDPLPLLSRYLAGRQVLLVLDNGEQVAGRLRPLLAELLARTRRPHLLLTSREPLGLDSESVLRLDPLQTQAGAALGAPLSAAATLFVARAQAVLGEGPGFDAEALAQVEQLCAGLDGLPLAIEIAAAQVASLGLAGLAQRAGSLLRLLARGRRGLPERQRTLQALLDWSYALLEPEAQTLLRQVSVFRGAFTPAEAGVLALAAGVPEAALAPGLARLQRCSLLRPLPGEDGACRLLYTTRAYAEHQLEQAGEHEAAWRRRALQLCTQVESANHALAQVRHDELAAWHAQHAGRLDDLRAGLDAMLGPGGDAAIAVRLCVAAGPMVLEYALYAEFRPRVARALDLAARPGAVEAAWALRLQSLACFVGATAASENGQRSNMVARSEALAAAAGTRDDRIHAAFSRCTQHYALGDYQALAREAEQVRSLSGAADDDLAWRLLGERFLGVARFHLGDLDEAERLLRRVLAFDCPLAARHYLGHTSKEVLMRVWLARLQWLRGHGDEARRLAEEALAREDELASPMGLSNLLGHAVVPIALWQGDDRRAAEGIAQLHRHAVERSHDFWVLQAEGFRRVLALRRAQGASTAGAGFSTPSPLHNDLLATLAEPMLVPATVERVRAGLVGWNAAEVMRIEALQRWHRQPGDASVVPALQAALALAQRQGARAWALRVATSLCEVQARQPGFAAARAQLTGLLAGGPPPDANDARRAAHWLAATAVGGPG
jgi:predicted ATPase/DNA-binding winged helix-turn-helix (wHTH) protein